MQIPVYKPKITETEKKYVNECLESSWISSKGKFIPLFEKRFAQFISTKYAASVSNGTVALHLALLALGIGPGDEVLVPTLTYIASANAIRYCGATPVFVDSHPKTWQIDPKKIIEKISTKSKAILVVHLYGYPSEMECICKIASKYRLAIIEDCAEAFGTFYHKKHVGNFGDIATFSFFGNKTITCGEGGMVATNNREIDKKIRCLKGQGLAEGREYFHDILGYNYRLTNIQAAIGLAQLEQASKILKAKRSVAHTYMKLLSSLPLHFLMEGNQITNSYWMCCLLAEDKEQRDNIRCYLKAHGVETRPFFIPLHLMPYYLGKSGDYPVAESLSDRGLNLPSWPDLSNMQIEMICNLIKEVFQCAIK